MYYTFGALGGNLIAHMILVSKMVNTFKHSRVVFFTPMFSVLRFPFI